MADWAPKISNRRGPRYRTLVEQLDEDIRSGRVRAGTKLPPQRDMADKLGWSVGTVSRAYAEAVSRGLISGEVGRGTFVLRRRGGLNAAPSLSQETINLALNVPPSTGEEHIIAAALSKIAADPGLSDMLAYLPHQGQPEHREAIATWMTSIGIDARADTIFITQGAQHALSIALGIVAEPREVVLTESLTYSGMMALSVQCGYPLHGVAVDQDGLVPEAMDRAFEETGARVIFATPTLQTPTATVMPPARRQAIIEILKRRNAYLIEDDAYAFLFQTPPRPLSLSLPEQSFYLTSFAKCLAPGLRIGAMIAPERFKDRCINGLRTSGWMATPIMAEVVYQLLQNGGLSEQISLKRQEALLRDAAVSRALADWLPAKPAEFPSFHRWLPMPAGRSVTDFISQSAQAGITLAPPHALRPYEPASQGVRLCLGAAASVDQLADALAQLRTLLERSDSLSVV